MTYTRRAVNKEEMANSDLESHCRTEQNTGWTWKLEL